MKIFAVICVNFLIWTIEALVLEELASGMDGLSQFQMEIYCLQVKDIYRDSLKRLL
jgi:hypothetical protein